MEAFTQTQPEPIKYNPDCWCCNNKAPTDPQKLFDWICAQKFPQLEDEAPPWGFYAMLDYEIPRFKDSETQTQAETQTTKLQKPMLAALLSEIGSSKMLLIILLVQVISMLHASYLLNYCFSRLMVWWRLIWPAPMLSSTPPTSPWLHVASSLIWSRICWLAGKLHIM